MRNIKVLDCTLRDGGRIINCEFKDTVIAGIAKGLTSANIDIIELGFLRSQQLVHYHEHCTFFNTPEQIQAFIPKSNQKTLFVAFVDFLMYDFSKLEKCDGNSVRGIRVGFTKTQFDNQRNILKKDLMTVKQQGYLLFVQGVNTTAYSDRALLDLIDFINEIEPYSFGIVDTYGAMYLEDIVHIYSLVDYNLKKNIGIDVHSHNNFQLSFAFAQQIITLADEKREIILDATLNGMGKCAGNLNTELIADFLVRKKNYDYDMDAIFDIIDRYLYPLKKSCTWGYSIPAFMAGIYKAHPNNVIYLTEKYRLNSKDIKYIISSISEDVRQRYDYENIARIYKEYCAHKVDDEKVLERLWKQLENQRILVLAPGNSIEQYHNKIKEYINKTESIVICVNFVPQQLKYDYLFYANTIHWEKISAYVDKSKCILASNIHSDIEGSMLVDYSRLVVEDSFLGDNSTIMLLNLLKKVRVNSITLAGFDGLKKDGENYVDETFPSRNDDLDFSDVNSEVKHLLEQYENRVEGKIKIDFLTPSIYQGMTGVERLDN